MTCNVAGPAGEAPVGIDLRSPTGGSQYAEIGFSPFASGWHAPQSQRARAMGIVVTGAVDGMEGIRRKIDDAIAAMLVRAEHDKYDTELLMRAYTAAHRKRVPTKLEIKPFERPFWEALFGFQTNPHHYFRRGDPAVELNPITIRHLRAVRGALKALDVCKDAPELSADISSWDAFLDHVLLAIAKRSPLFDVPFRELPHFVGRDDTMEEIDRALIGRDGRIAIAALHGLRGVGKTALAAEYANRHRAAYHAVCWIGAHTDSAIRAGLMSLGVRLGWIRSDSREELAIDFVKARLSRAPESILLIFDNAPDATAIRDYLPQRGACKVLITSNFHAWGELAIELHVWSPETGADYLIARAGRGGARHAAQGLSELLGGLPLALAQAAAYCDYHGISFADYIGRYEKATIEFLDDKLHAPADYHPEHHADHKVRLTVARTFKLAIEAAKGPAAEPILMCVALLASEPVPLFLFREAREKLGGAFASTTAGKDIEDGVLTLLSLALVQRVYLHDDRDPSLTTDAIALHPLVREIAAAQMSDARRSAVEISLVQSLAALYPRDAYHNPRVWFHCASLTPHVLALWERKVSWNADPMAWPSVVDRVVGYFQARAWYVQADALMREILTYAEETVGPEHHETATALNSLGVLLDDQQNPGAARPYLERALAIREKVLPSYHPALATSLDTLGCCLRRLGDLGGARPLLERALIIKEGVLGPDNADTALTMNNLAYLLKDMGENTEAIALYRRALKVFEKIEGDGIRVAMVLDNLGELLIASHREEARRALERSLAIYEKEVGPLHPDTAMGHNNLGGLFDWEYDLSPARHHYECALAITEKMLRPNDPRIGTTLSNLSRIIYLQRDPSWRILSKRALAIFKENQHPDTNLVRLGHWWRSVFWYVGPLVKWGTSLFILWLIWRVMRWLFW